MLWLQTRQIYFGISECLHNWNSMAGKCWNRRWPIRPVQRRNWVVWYWKDFQYDHKFDRSERHIQNIEKSRWQPDWFQCKSTVGWRHRIHLAWYNHVLRKALYRLFLFRKIWCLVPIRRLKHQKSRQLERCRKTLHKRQVATNPGLLWEKIDNNELPDPRRSIGTSARLSKDQTIHDEENARRYQKWS